MGRWLALMVMAAVSLGAATSPGSASAGADRGAGIVVRVYFADQEDLNQLATELDVWEVNHQARYLVALLLPGQQAALVAAGYRVEPAPEKDPRAQLLGQPLAGQAGGIPGFPCYRTVEETHADLEALALANPTLAEWFKVGESWEKAVGGGPGYDLFILKLTNRTISGPKPVLALMAAIHAREYTTAEMAARFAQDLVDGYATDPDATWLLDHHEIHILAQANPDGRKIAETGLLWRKNVDDDDGCSNPDAWGTDLNRNSSFQWGGGGASTDPCSVTYRGPAAASEPEVQAAQLYLAGIFPDQRGPRSSAPSGEGSATSTGTRSVRGESRAASTRPREPPTTGPTVSLRWRPTPSSWAPASSSRAARSRTPSSPTTCPRSATPRNPHGGPTRIPWVPTPWRSRRCRLQSWVGNPSR
jgi:hypothetical protein